MNSMEKRTENRRLIISHGDGDGVCACAIAYRALKEDVIVLFAQPFNLHLLLNKMMESGEIYDFREIYIIDIAYSKKTKKMLKKLLECHSPKPYVYWIDHHKSSLKVEDDFPQFKCVVNNDYSASELCAFYFDQLTPLARIGSASDKMTMLSRMDDMYDDVESLRMALAVVGVDDVFRFKIMRKLSRGMMPSEIPEIAEKAKICDDERKKFLELAWNSIAYEDDDLIIVDAHGKNIQGHAGSVASEIAISKGKMVFLIYGVDKTVITGRSHKRIEVNIGDFMRKYLSGGGHKNAGSSTFYGDIKGLIEQLPKWFHGECELIRKVI